MLTLSHIPAQHFISFQDEATDISMSSVSLCLERQLSSFSPWLSLWLRVSLNTAQ